MADEHRIARLLLSLSPGDGVLDVACGTGNFSRDFAQHGRTDRTGGGHRRVRDHAHARGRGHAQGRTGERGLRPRRRTGAAVPGRETFDAVCCFAAFHLFADPMRALDRMTEVLTPGGRIAIFTTARHRTMPVRTAESLLAIRSGARLFEEREVVDALEGRGFEDVRQRIAGVTQFVGARRA